MTTKQKIRLVEARVAQVRAHLSNPNCTDADTRSGDAFVYLCNRALVELRREQDRYLDYRPGTLADWTENRVALGFSHELMADIRREDGALLEGWNALMPPTNETQRAVAFLHDVQMLLGSASVEVEDAHPEMAHYFASEREDFRALYKV